MTNVAAVQPGFSIEIPVKEKTGEFFVFYPADVIDGLVKANNPAWAAGGVLRPKAITLQYKTGYIRRCEITQLRPAMVSQSASNVQPAERSHHKGAYILNEGESSRVIGKLPNGDPDGYLRTPWHPVDEVDRLTSQGDGLVRMPIPSADAAIAAQFFLFPNWEEIVAGRELLPVRIADLQTHLRSRLQAATSDFGRAVVIAALQACDDFATWGRRAVTEANAVYRQMEVKGNAWALGSDANAASEQLGLQRSDSLIQTQGEQMNRLTDVMATFVERQNGIPPAEASQPSPSLPPQIDADRYARFVEWERQEALRASAQPAAPPVVETVETTSGEGSEDTTGADVPLPSIGATVEVEGRAAKVIAHTRTGKAQIQFLDDEKTKYVAPDQITQ